MPTAPPVSSAPFRLDVACRTFFGTAGSLCLSPVRVRQFFWRRFCCGGMTRGKCVCVGAGSRRCESPAGHQGYHHKLWLRDPATTADQAGLSHALDRPARPLQEVAAWPAARRQTTRSRGLRSTGARRGAAGQEQRPAGPGSRSAARRVWPRIERAGAVVQSLQLRPVFKPSAASAPGPLYCGSPRPRRRMPTEGEPACACSY